MWSGELAESGERPIAVLELAQLEGFGDESGKMTKICETIAKELQARPVDQIVSKKSNNQDSFDVSWLPCLNCGANTVSGMTNVI